MDVFSGVAGREQVIIDSSQRRSPSRRGRTRARGSAAWSAICLPTRRRADIRVFCAEDEDRVIGAAVFTRLSFPEDLRRVVLLSPMAVAVGRQRQGVGQALLAHALAALRSEGVEVAITYGDPAFYGKVGFMPISEDRPARRCRSAFPMVGWDDP